MAKDITGQMAHGRDRMKDKEFKKKLKKAMAELERDWDKASKAESELFDVSSLPEEPDEDAVTVQFILEKEKQEVIFTI